MQDTTASGADVALVCQEGGMAGALERALAQEGRRVARAPCAPEAMETLRRAAPAVIVLEARNGDGAGFDLLRAIRADTALSGARVLVLQDTGRPIDRRRATALGADGFLAMPFRLEALRAALGRLDRPH